MELALLREDLNWKRKDKRAPLSRFGFHPDAPTVMLDNLLADRQPDPASGILHPGMQPFENSEYDLGMFTRDADSVVRDREHPLPVFFPGRDAH